jgi:heme exporter protein D
MMAKGGVCMFINVYSDWNDPIFNILCVIFFFFFAYSIFKLYVLFVVQSVKELKRRHDVKARKKAIEEKIRKSREQSH